MSDLETITRDDVLEALRDVYDPEIPVNIVDLGLVWRRSSRGGCRCQNDAHIRRLWDGTLHSSAGRMETRRSRGNRRHKR